MSDINDFRFFRKFQSASRVHMLGRLLHCILSRVSPASEGVSQADWGTFCHRIFSLGNGKETSPSMLARRIRALFKNSATLMRVAELLEASATAPNIANFRALQWLMELEEPEKVEQLLVNAQHDSFNLVLDADRVTDRLTNL